MPETYELAKRRRKAIDGLEEKRVARTVTLAEYQRIRWAIEGAQTEDEVERIEREEAR